MAIVCEKYPELKKEEAKEKLEEVKTEAVVEVDNTTETEDKTNNE